MSPDRERLFTKRGAAIGVISVIVVTLLLVAVAAGLGALLQLVF